MDSFLHFFSNLHSPSGIESLIRHGGLFLLVAIVFAETGLLAGFFLPGDSLLVTAGVFASRSMSGGEPLLNIYTLNFSLIAAAIIGDQVGYLLGRKVGVKIFDRSDGHIFKKKHVIEAHAFYEKHGGKAIMLARFIPILRTFVPFIAGVAVMSYRKFFVFNMIGGISWVLSMTMLGYFIGQSPLSEKLHQIIFIVIAISLLPMLITLLRKIFGKKSSAGKVVDENRS